MRTDPISPILLPVILGLSLSSCEAMPGKPLHDGFIVSSAEEDISAARDALHPSSGENANPPVIHRDLPLTTQGPLWPPSELVDQDGNFVLVGTALKAVAPGVVAPVPSQAVLVSKNTVPPLDASGKEDFSNPFGSPYTIIRSLDLGDNSQDLKMPLYTVSYGPFRGSFGGGPRIPMQGKSAYNLNGALPSCPELFPAISQRDSFMLPSAPLHAARIWGFTGDQVAYNADTGQPYDPFLRSGTGCGAGCSGENVVNFRSRTQPITLGDWLSASGKVQITLTRFNAAVNAYTAARFKFTFKDLLPRSIYSVWGIRMNATKPAPEIRLPTAMGVPNIFVTDEHGSGEHSVELPNPFPSAATDDAGLRIIGLGVGFHSDYQNWGACPARLGPGADIHLVFNTLADGTLDLTSFVTKDAP